MKKISKIIKNNIFGFIIGAIIFGSIGVYAASILSSSVVYDNSTSGGSSKTVQGALDELYSKIKYGDATAEDIVAGKTALVGASQIIGTLILNEGKVSFLFHSSGRCSWTNRPAKASASATAKVSGKAIVISLRTNADSGGHTCTKNGISIGVVDSTASYTYSIFDVVAGDSISVSTSSSTGSNNTDNTAHVIGFIIY